LEHLAQRDRGGGASEGVAAARAALARHDLVAAQTPEDLLEIASWDALALADHADLHGLAVAVVGEIEYPADRILHLEREAHDSRLPDRCAASTAGITTRRARGTRDDFRRPRLCDPPSGPPRAALSCRPRTPTSHRSSSAAGSPRFEPPGARAARPRDYADRRRGGASSSKPIRAATGSAEAIVTTTRSPSS